MTRSASVSRLAPEFDDFLFAPIGDDGNGMLLSVLSALARLDLDPWQEAAQLARLPGEKATQRLAALIAELPDGPTARRDLGAIAPRLIALLPRQAGADFPARATLPAAAAETSRAVIRAICFVIFMAFAMSAHWMIASRQPPAPVDDAHGPAASTVSPPLPPPSPGRSRGGGLG